MNKKFKRSIAAALAIAALCNPLGASRFFPKLGAAPTAAYAADNNVVSSGLTYSYTTYDRSSDGYILYFEPQDTYAKTYCLVGCKTTKDNVSVSIPETINGWKVVSILDRAFEDQTRLTSVYLPKTITAISDGTFLNCKKLSLVYFNKNSQNLPSVTSIGREAFKNCENLFDVNLNNVTYIGYSAFDGCSSLSYVYAPKLTSLGRSAFSNCYRLRNVDFSNSTLTQIPNQAFKYSCSWSGYELDVKLPSTVKTIGKEAFYNVNGLTQIDLSNVTSIGDSAFADCHHLKNVFTGDKLANIGTRAFYGCDPMTYFVCKNDGVYIGTEAIGYAHQRNYTGKKSNFTLWGTTNNSNMNKYACNYGFAYKNTKDAPNDMLKKFKGCNWTSGNTSTMFADANKKYLFIDGHKTYVDSKYLNANFEGSCRGMSAICALVYNKYLTVDQFAPGYSTISSLNSNCSDFTKSFVNTIWQSYDGRSDYKLSHAGGAATFCEQDSEMLKYIEYITYGADIASVNYAVTSSMTGHSVVCLGMEFQNDSNRSYWTYKDYDARIILYDVNDSKSNFIDWTKCMYVNTKTGKWRMNTQFNSDNSLYKNFSFEINYKPETIVSNRKSGLKGMDFVYRLLDIKK